MRKLKSTSSSITVQAKVSQNAYYKKPTKASLKVYKSSKLVKEVKLLKYMKDGLKEITTQSS